MMAMITINEPRLQYKPKQYERDFYPMSESSESGGRNAFSETAFPFCSGTAEEPNGLVWLGLARQPSF